MFKLSSAALLSEGEATHQSKTNSVFRAGKGDYFFAGMAILFPIIATLGFYPSYQAMTTGTMVPHWLVHIHGALMTSWLLVFLTQAMLASAGNFSLHRKLGIAAGALGILVWLAMWTVSIHALIAYHPSQENFLFDLLLMEFYAIITFGTFFTWGMLVRKKDRTAHKRLLTLATLVLLQAAIDRIHWLPMLGLGYPYVFFIYLDLLIVPIVIYDFITLKHIHRVTWTGASFIIVVQLTVSLLWGSPGWHRFWYGLSSPIMEKVIEVKLTDSQSDALLGDYGDKNWHMAVNRDSGRLYLQLPGQPKLELTATSPTELFLRKAIWQLSFIKGPNGKITKIINREGSGRWEAARLNQP